MKLVHVKAVALLLLSGLSAASSATIAAIDSRPAPGDAVVAERIFADSQWFGLAVGFNVGAAGYVTRISTTLSMSPSQFSNAALTFGLASNQLIGNPSMPTYFSPPPGSIFEANVCSTIPDPAVGGRSACDIGLGQIAGIPTYGLMAGQYLDFTADIFLPEAGAYWLYTRFHDDSTFASWLENASDPSLLVARETGTCTGVFGGCSVADRTFLLARSAGPTPGVFVEFDPLPEPETYALFGVGMLALVMRRCR